MRCIKAQERVLNSYVDMIEHSWNDGIITLEPTYEAEGEKTYTCTVCESKKTEAVEKRLQTEEIVDTDTNVKIEVSEDSNAVLDSYTILSVEKMETVVSKEMAEKLVDTIGKKSEILAMYDISLILNDVSVQPGGKVAVTIPAPENIGEYGSIVVIFIDDNGNITQHETRINEDGTVTFLTDHFSCYAIVGLPQNSVNTTMIVLFAVLFIVLLAGGLASFLIIKKKKEVTDTEVKKTTESEEELS